MRTGAADLDDVDDLIAGDTEGLLPVAALAGAQVRAVAEAMREGVLEPLASLRPRSVVVVHGVSGVVRDAVALVVACVANRVDVPIVSVPALPGWVGPLDVVVVAGDDAGDMALADAAARAQRRRAEFVVAAPVEGPLRDALGGSGIDLSPRVHVDARFRFAGYVATLLAVFSALSDVRFTGPVPLVSDIADALDEEAAADHPTRETFHNRAKLLAARLADRRVVWTGDSPAASVVAARNASSLFVLSGKICAAADIDDVARLSRESWTAGGASPVDSIFHDPQIDGPLADQPPRVLAVTTAARRWYAAQRIAGIPDAEAVSGDVDEAESVVRPQVPAGPEDLADGPSDLPGYVILALRVDIAAVYLHLTGIGER